MLLNLPLELLIDIALYLSISQKLQLALTCKRLKGTIFEQCFYETLDLLHKRKKTKSIVLKFRKNPSNGQKVRVLNIPLDLLSDRLFSKIPFIFPNVVKFYDFSFKHQSRYEESSSGFIKWKDTLEHLGKNASKRAGVIYKLLENNVFSRLTNFSISPLEKGDGSHINFLECIKNAPVLENLTVVDCTITIGAMETIHSSCPLLATFKMITCAILVADDELLPKEIEPAFRLSYFLLKSTVIFDQHYLFLDYLTRKYTKLIKFEFYPSFSEDKLTLLFPDQDIEQMKFNPDYIARKNKLRATCESYSISAFKILSSLPNTLRILQTTSLDIYNAMSILSKKRVNVTRLELFGIGPPCITAFTSPEDTKLFKNLPFLKRLSIMLDPSLLKYKQAPASTSVTQLEIIINGTSPHSNGNIGCILSMFPSLNDLAINYSGARLIGYEDDLPPKTYPNLTRLYVGPSPTHFNLLAFIRDTAPNLKDLYWCIFGKHIKELLERKHKNQPIIIHLNEPDIEDERAHYTIDLTGFSLDCFHLEIDLFEKFIDNKEDILLELKNKDDAVKGRFVVSKNSQDVYLSNYCNQNVKETIKTKITVRYDYTRMIKINSRVSIDL